MPSKKASLDTLEDLHRILAEYFIDALGDEPAPALVNAARQFLKDNGIEAAQGHKVLNKLVDGLPEFDDEEVA